MSAAQLMKALLDYPADKLDKSVVKYICETFINNAPATASKAKKPRKPADPTKPKRTLNSALAARNACWASNKADGMSYKDFCALWKTFTQAQKDEWKAKIEAKADIKAEVKEEEEEVDEVVNDELDAAIDDIASSVIDEE
jgi:hypothetical protein